MAGSNLGNKAPGSSKQGKAGVGLSLPLLAQNIALQIDEILSEESPDRGGCQRDKARGSPEDTRSDWVMPDTLTLAEAVTRRSDGEGNILSLSKDDTVVGSTRPISRHLSSNIPIASGLQLGVAAPATRQGCAPCSR